MPGITYLKTSSPVGIVPIDGSLPTAVRHPNTN
jgi:hypothetical protein